MPAPRLKAELRMILEQVRSHSEVASGILDLDLYQIQVALMWIQVAAKPDEMGIAEHELEAVCDYVNESIETVLGTGQQLQQVFTYLGTAAGADAMKRHKVKGYQQDLIDYFGTMITNPDEHKRRMQAARAEGRDDG